MSLFRKRNWGNKSLFVGVGGVALADILANSVAMMIILIVLTLNVKKQQEALEQEQSDDISALLSRKLAENIVMNDLPSSKPAVLHDYENSEIDLNPSHGTMPIVEFHDRFIRLYYHNIRFDQQKLLQKNNLFDRYLSKLSERQRMSIRVDIYSINLYYLAMSIFKDHGIDVRHWHFLGYTPDFKETVKDARDIFASNIPEQFKELKPLEKDLSEDQQMLEGTSLFLEKDSQAQIEEHFERKGLLEKLIEITSRKREESTDNNLKSQLERDPELRDLVEQLAKIALKEGKGESLFDANDLKSLINLLQKDFPPSQNLELEEMTNEKQDIKAFKEFAKKLTTLYNNPPFEQREIQGSSITGTPQKFTLRLPQETKPCIFNCPQETSEPLLTEHPDFEAVLFAYLLDTLQIYQDAYHAGQILDLDLRFLTNNLQKALSVPDYLKFSPHREEALDLARQRQNHMVRDPFGPSIEQKKSVAYRGAQVLVPQNAFANRAVVYLDRYQVSWENKVYDFDNEFTVQLREVPAIYEGTPRIITEQTLFLVPRKQKRRSEIDWRSVALYDPHLGGLMIGYVQAAVPEEGGILLAGESNEMRVNAEKINYFFPVTTRSQGFLLALVYASILILLLIALIRILR